MEKKLNAFNEIVAKPEVDCTSFAKQDSTPSKNTSITDANDGCNK